MKIKLELDTTIAAEREVANNLRANVALCLYIDGIRFRATPVDFDVSSGYDAKGRLYPVTVQTNLNGEAVL